MNKLDEARDLLANNYCHGELELYGTYCSAGAVGKVLDIPLHTTESYDPYSALDETPEIRVLAKTICEQYPEYREKFDRIAKHSDRNPYVEVVYWFNDDQGEEGLNEILAVFEKAATKLDESA